MNLPKLHTHHVTYIIRADEEECVIGLTENNLKQFKRHGDLGGLFALIPCDEPNGQAIAYEIAKRCNAYDMLVKLLQAFASQNGYDPSDMLDGDDPMRGVYESSHALLRDLDEHPYKKVPHDDLMKFFNEPRS